MKLFVYWPRILTVSVAVLLINEGIACLIVSISRSLIERGGGSVLTNRSRSFEVEGFGWGEGGGGSEKKNDVY